MARVTKVTTSRKDHTCGRGGHLIPKGDGYLTATPGFRAQPKFRCLQHPFRPSELTTSLASEPLSALEAAEDAAAEAMGMEDLEAAHESVTEALNDYRDLRQEALDAWENGNGQLEEYVEQATEAADVAEGFQFGETEFEYEGEWADDDETDPADPEEYADAFAAWMGERRDEFTSMLSEISL